MGIRQPKNGERRSERRQQILDAAVRVFARKGFHLARVADIAREAGVAYGLVYHYFRNKEDLLEAIFAGQWAVFLEVLRAIENDPRGLQGQLESLSSFLVESYKDILMLSCT